MGYWLGIDVGTTHTAAALCREQAGRHGLPEVVMLGSRSAVVTSVVYRGPDGQVVVGEAAERQAATHPERVVRDYLRHVGERDPVTIGATQHPASTIAAWVIRWVVDRVAQREGEPAQSITITHPAGWGAHHLRAMTDALRAADLPEVTFCPESLAAAASYSIREPAGGNSTIAVYDLGGGTFDAAVVHRTGAGTSSVLGTPERIERLGGASFDDAVFGHVLAAIPALGELDPDAPVPPAVAARLRRSFAACRRECAEAKEALSTGAEVTIPVLFPEIQTQVTVVRDEFEDLIRPLVAQTLEALRRALRSAGVDPVDLDAVLLVGGSSRVPLVARAVSADLGCPVVAGADPETAIALGAALSGLPASTAQLGPVPANRAVPTVAGFGGPVPSAVQANRSSESAPSAASVARRAGEPETPSWGADPPDGDSAEPGRRWPGIQRTAWLAAAGALGLVLTGGAVAAVLVTSLHRPQLPTPATPAIVVTSTIPQTPAAAVPAPAPDAAAGTGAGNVPPAAPVGGVVPAPPPPAMAEEPAGATPGPAAVPEFRSPHSTSSHPSRRSTHKAPPPAPETDPPPPRTPDWVKDARDW